MEHRSEAQKLSGLTESQKAGLELGRRKGTNNLLGIPKSEESKRKRSESMKRWAKENPEAAALRSVNNRAENHYNWKGGVTNLNQAIRRLSEFRKWASAVKSRDKGCVNCGSKMNLESHHIVLFSDLLHKYKIETRGQARSCEELWDINNGITLCEKCHAEEHGINYTTALIERHYIEKPKKQHYGKHNNNWRGGLVEKKCLYCLKVYYAKQCRAKISKYCSRSCRNEGMRKRVPSNAAGTTKVIHSCP
jgi:hypothetical protein